MGACIDMQFLLECSTYKLHKRREIPYLQAAMYYSVYYINILMTTFLTIFRGFPNTFRRFSKILQKLSGQTIVSMSVIKNDIFTCDSTISFLSI